MDDNKAPSMAGDPSRSSQTEEAAESTQSLPSAQARAEVSLDETADEWEPPCKRAKLEEQEAHVS